MTKSGRPEITAEKILQRIGEELERREMLSRDRGLQDDSGIDPENQENNLFFENPVPKKQSNRGTATNFLWKYGIRHARLIKKVPVLKAVAEKFYWKLSRRINP